MSDIECFFSSILLMHHDDAYVKREIMLRQPIAALRKGCQMKSSPSGPGSESPIGGFVRSPWLACLGTPKLRPSQWRASKANPAEFLLTALASATLRHAVEGGGASMGCSEVSRFAI